MKLVTLYVTPYVHSTCALYVIAAYVKKNDVEGHAIHVECHFVFRRMSLGGTENHHVGCNKST